MMTMGDGKERRRHVVVTVASVDDDARTRAGWQWSGQ